MIKQIVEVVDPVVLQMFHRLPAPGANWPLDQRVLWLQAMESVLHMVYGKVDTIDITGLLPVQQQAATTLIGALAEENARAAEADNNEKTSSEPDPPPVKKLGGAPSKAGRPEGLPANIAMAREAIVDLGGRASAPQIRDWVRKKYWSGLPDHWTATLWNFVQEGKLARDGINFILPGAATSIGKELAAPKVTPTKAPIVIEPKKPAAPAVQQQPAKPQGISFEYNNKKILLPTSTAYSLIGKLRIAMGKGAIGEAFLAERVFGSNTENNRQQAKRICLDQNKALAEVGLVVEYKPGIGLWLKEIEA